MVNQSKSRRVCQYPGCGTLLSSYNKSSFCLAHQTEARPDINMGARRASPRIKKTSQLRFYEIVLAVNPYDEVEFAAFLDSHHYGYHEFKEANPTWSQKDVLEFFDAKVGSEGIHRPELFFWRQYNIKEMFNNLIGGADFGLGAEQFNAEMSAYQVSLQLLVEDDGVIRLGFSDRLPKLEDMLSGFHIFRRCLIEILNEVDTKERIILKHQKLFEPYKSQAIDMMLIHGGQKG